MKKVQFCQVVFVVMFLFSCGNITPNKEKITENSAGENQESNGLLWAASTPPNAKYKILLTITQLVEGTYNFGGIAILKNYIESRTNGEVGVEVQPGLASNSNEGVQGLMNDSFDIFQTTGDAASFWKPLSVMDLPYMFPDDRTAEAVMDDPVFKKAVRDGFLNATNHKVRLMIMTNSGGWRNIATTQKKVQELSDMKGLKIRTVPSKVQQELVKALGAAPTAITWTELYTSLSSGVIDGTKNSIVDIQTANLDDSLKFYLLDGHAYMNGYWWMNNDKLLSLPEQYQAVVVDGFNAMSWYLRSYPKFAEIDAYKQFLQKGGSIYKPNTVQLAEFKNASQSVYDWFLDTADHETKEIYDLFNQTIAEKIAEINTLREQEY